MSGVEIRPATSADAPGIRRLFERTFGAPLSEEEWRWKFEQDPDGWFGVVAVVDGDIAGNYGGWGMRFLLDGVPTLLYSVGDVSTDPSVRRLGGRGVYRAMAEAFYDLVGRQGVPFCFGFPNARALQISHRLVGSRTLFPIREVVVPCEAFPPAAGDFQSGDAVGESFDAFWTEASRVLTHAAVRDRLRVNWRFHARPNRYYRMVRRERGSRVLGWAVLSVSGEHALVADFLGLQSDGNDLVPLFAGVAAEAAKMGARRLVFWETPGGPASAVLRALPGERRDAGFPLIVRTFDDPAADRFARAAHLVPSLYDLV